MTVLSLFNEPQRLPRVRSVHSSLRHSFLQPRPALGCQPHLALLRLACFWLSSLGHRTCFASNISSIHHSYRSSDCILMAGTMLVIQRVCNGPCVLVMAYSVGCRFLKCDHMKGRHKPGICCIIATILLCSCATSGQILRIAPGSGSHKRHLP